MSQRDPPFSMLDEAAIAAAELRRDPYDFAFVEPALSPRLKAEVLADAPEIPDRGSYGLPSLRYGSRFEAVVEDLLTQRFRRLVEKKFDMDLTPYPPCIVMMGNTTGPYNFWCCAFLPPRGGRNRKAQGNALGIRSERQSAQP
jgi:SM-20-related protein